MQLAGEPGHFHHGHVIDGLDTGFARGNAADNATLTRQDGVGKIRFYGQGAGDADDIGGTAVHGLRHGFGRAEAAGNHQRNGNPLADFVGVIQEVGFPVGGTFPYALGTGHGRVLVVTTGNFQQIETLAGQCFGHGHGFFFAKTAPLEIGGIEFDADGVVIANGLTDSPVNFQRETHAVCQ